MPAIFRKLFFPALFEGIDHARSVQLLTFIFRLTLVITLVSFVLNLLIEPNVERSLPNIVVFLSVLSLMRLLKYGKIKLAAVLYLALTSIAILSLVVISGGITSPVFSMLLVIVFCTALVLGGGAGLLAIGVSLLIGAICLVLQSAGRLPIRLVYYPFDYFIVQVAVFVSIGGLLFFVMKNLREALEQAQREINERRYALASFQKLERRYKAIFDHTNDAVILMDLESTILDINQRGAEMFGCEKADLIGRNGLDFVSPRERYAGRARLVEVIQGQILPIYERNMVRKDGTEFLTEVNLSLVYDENGVPIQAQSVLRDITERKRVENALRDIEHRYQTLFEGNNDGIFIIGLDGMIEEVNQQAAKMLGYKPREIVGVTADFFVAPEERNSVDSQLSELVEKGNLPIYERRVRKRDGTWLTFEINAGVVYDVNGKPQNIQSIVRDITERKRAETELRALIRQLERQRAKIHTSLVVSKAAISNLNPQSLMQQTVDLIKTRFEYYYVGLFMVEKDRQIAILRAGTGEEGQKLIAAGHHLPVGEGSMIGWCIANKQPRIALDVGLDAVHFDNPLLPLTRSEIALPLIARGEVIGAMTVQSEVEAAFSDEDIAVLQVMIDLVAVAITNARLHEEVTAYTEELEQRVRERTEQLQTTNRELEAFSYSVSHDLRTPLRAINGYASILLEDFAHECSPPVRNFQEKIRGNAVRMGELVDGLLAFSRLGRKRMQKSDVDPRALVQEILEEHEAEISQRNVQIHFGDLPVCEADALLLKQVFANLIGNSFKFTRDVEAPRIEIGSFSGERGLTYYVRDNGAGFDMQYVDRLFGVFQRLHRDEEFEGTGVGLAIIQRIIHRHGGEVWAEAKLGEGATFYFTLGILAIDDSGIFF